MGDYTAVIRSDNSPENMPSHHFLFLVKPKNEGGDDMNSNWEGSFGLIKR